MAMSRFQLGESHAIGEHGGANSRVLDEVARHGINTMDLRMD